MSAKNYSPSKICDNLYHIGVKGGPCYLLESSQGLVLIDTAFPESTKSILSNLNAIGKSVRDIKHIVHTHGHIDHVGSTSQLLKLCSAKTYIGDGDADAVMGKNELIFAKEMDMDFTETFTPDVILHDGDILSLGDTQIKFISTPGHTLGTMSLFFDVYINGEKHLAGMFGGAGLNTLTEEYLNKYSLPLSLRNDFISSIDKIMNIPVEVHIGNHPGDCNFHEKILHMNEKINPFLAQNTYKSFLIKRKAEAKKAFGM